MAADVGGIYFVSTLGKSLACTNGFWTYDDAKGTGCDSCLAQLYSTKGSKCESCAGQQMDAGTVIVIILAAIVILALLAVLSKVGFNWAAISISWNFLQVWLHLCTCIHWSDSTAHVPRSKPATSTRHFSLPGPHAAGSGEFDLCELRHRVATGGSGFSRAVCVCPSRRRRSRRRMHWTNFVLRKVADDGARTAER